MIDPPPDNPYAPPAAELIPSGKQRYWTEFTDKKLQTLLAISFCLRVAAFSFGLRFVFHLAQTQWQGRYRMSFLDLPQPWGLRVLAMAAAIHGAAFVGCSMRKNWGLPAGMLAGLLLLTDADFRTKLIGGAILIFLIRAKPLFGPDRLVHAEMRQELRRRKRERERRQKLA